LHLYRTNTYWDETGEGDDFPFRNDHSFLHEYEILYITVEFGFFDPFLSLFLYPLSGINELQITFLPPKSSFTYSFPPSFPPLFQHITVEFGIFYPFSEGFYPLFHLFSHVFPQETHPKSSFLLLFRGFLAHFPPPFSTYSTVFGYFSPFLEVFGVFFGVFFPYYSHIIFETSKMHVNIKGFYPFFIDFRGFLGGFLRNDVSKWSKMAKKGSKILSFGHKNPG